MYKIDHLFTKTSISFPPFHLRSLRFCIKKSCFMKYYVVDSSYTFYSRRGFTPVKLFDPLTCWALPHPLMIRGAASLLFLLRFFLYPRDQSIWRYNLPPRDRRSDGNALVCHVRLPRNYGHPKRKDPPTNAHRA